MLFTAALSYFLISWSSIFLLDYVLRIKNFAPYVNFANKYGLEVAPFQLRVYTARYNGGAYLPTSKEVSVTKKLKSLWFTFGAMVALACMIGITIYLSHLLYRDTSYLLSLRPKMIPHRSIPHAAQQPTPLEATVLDDLPPSPAEEYDVLDGSGGSETGLIPIIPGVNLPWNHIPIFVVVLAIAAIIHEIGHSAAATTYNIRVNGFGVFLFGLYPGAFTDIDPESLRRNHPRHRLEVFGGGIWHNIVLAGIAYLMFLWSPYFLSPFFSQGQGVTVTGVDSRSGLYGAGGLSNGNVVISIDDCPVRKSEDWRECVRYLEKNKHGQCVPLSAVEASLASKTSMSLDELHCCDDFTNITHAHMCFESVLDVTTKHMVTKAQLLSRVGIVEPAQEVVHKKRKRSRQFSCLSAQYVTSQPTCSNTSSCALVKALHWESRWDQNMRRTSAEHGVQQCSMFNVYAQTGCYYFTYLDGVKDLVDLSGLDLVDRKSDDGEERVCVFAALFNGTQLARINVKNNIRPVLYVGNLDELIAYVKIDPLVARFLWVPHSYAESVELVPKYLFTLSLALGLLNSVPCYALDGQHIVIVCVNWSCKVFSRRRRQQMISIILSLGTLLLVANVIIGFVKMMI